jgi:2-oxoglutarate ferredoxin oxidoreductase subunit beta
MTETLIATERERPASTYNSGVKPVWCPGCGDYGVLSSFYEALSQQNIDPKDLAIVSGIGCSGRFSHFVKGYSFHCVHGRALPTATGLKLARPDLNVVVVGGDGDGLAIGGGHIAHAARRNPNMLYILLDNSIYGLTKGQISPTSPSQMITSTDPYGTYEDKLDPITMFLSYDVSFVARCFSSQPKVTTEIIREAMQHPGLAIIQVLSPCVTFNQDVTFKSIGGVIKPIPEHNVTDRREAMQLAMSGELYAGIFYRNIRPTLEGRIGDIGQGVIEQQGNVASLQSLFKPLT